MLQLRSVLNLADNSGAKAIMILGVSPRLGSKATVGQAVKCVVHGADPNGAVADREKVTAVIVRTRKEIRRKQTTLLLMLQPHHAKPMTLKTSVIYVCFFATKSFM